MKIEKTFYNNTKMPILVILGAEYVRGTVSPSVYRQTVNPQETETLTVDGDYISRLDLVIQYNQIDFGMSLKTMEQEPEITSFLKYEKFVLNYNETNEVNPPEYFQVSIIPLIEL
ncbi:MULTISPECIES: hypothetical protein [Xenorhabdus]|uniref:hypothetical protein n=1 Tax=Xenorhabdus TaxID=626 RepID=UPI0006468EC5|nr:MULTISPECIES: hypothetical protein [Xenorhabdus]MBC8945117.1 hypothetical protein [Xenorhabdus indica]